MMANRKVILDKNKKQLLDYVNASNKVYTNEELSILLGNYMEELKERSNPNLLINGLLRIWQRGDSMTINNTNWTYTADRFRAKGTGTVTKVSDGLKVSNNTNLQYRMEAYDYNTIKGKTVTLSYSVDHDVITRTYTISSNVVVDINLTSNQTLNWIKLELGSIATPISPLPYAEELAKCQRYYEIINATYMIPMVKTPTVFYLLPSAVFKVQKLKTPTVSFSHITDKSSVTVSFTGSLTGRISSQKISSITLSSEQSDSVYNLHDIRIDAEIYD